MVNKRELYVVDQKTGVRKLEPVVKVALTHVSQMKRPRSGNFLQQGQELGETSSTEVLGLSSPWFHVTQYCSVMPVRGLQVKRNFSDQ
jgi:hypothetical protein